MIEFRLLNENPLMDFKEACKITQGIEIDVHNTIYTQKDEVAYWIKQIVANHSTIRCIKFRMKASAPKSVVMQIIRATKGHAQPYVQSSRPDWVGKPRSTDPYEEKLFIQDNTAESFIEMCKQRLCNRTEDKTRQFMWEAVEELWTSDVPFLRAVGLCCHPACWWHDGLCPELNGCEGVRKLSQRIINSYGVRDGKEKDHHED